MSSNSQADIAKANADSARKLLATPPDQFDIGTLGERWLTDDFELHYPGGPPIPFARVWKGREAFAEFMSTYFREVKLEKMDIGECEGAGDNVYVAGVTYGTAVRTGKSFRSPWMLVWTFRDGRIAQMREYHDTQAMAAAFA